MGLYHSVVILLVVRPNIRVILVSTRPNRSHVTIKFRLFFSNDQSNKKNWFLPPQSVKTTLHLLSPLEAAPPIATLLMLLPIDKKKRRDIRIPNKPFQ